MYFAGTFILLSNVSIYMFVSKMCQYLGLIGMQYFEWIGLKRENQPIKTKICIYISVSAVEFLESEHHCCKETVHFVIVLSALILIKNILLTSAEANVRCLFYTISGIRGTLLYTSYLN